MPQNINLGATEKNLATTELYVCVRNISYTCYATLMLVIAHCERHKGKPIKHYAIKAYGGVDI
jgi:hypothetical protein